MPLSIRFNLFFKFNETVCNIKSQAQFFLVYCSDGSLLWVLKGFEFLCVNILTVKKAERARLMTWLCPEKLDLSYLGVSWRAIDPMFWKRYDLTEILWREWMSQWFMCLSPFNINENAHRLTSYDNCSFGTVELSLKGQCLWIISLELNSCRPFVANFLAGEVPGLVAVHTMFSLGPVLFSVILMSLPFSSGFLAYDFISPCSCSSRLKWFLITPLPRVAAPVVRFGRRLSAHYRVACTVRLWCDSILNVKV